MFTRFATALLLTATATAAFAGPTITSVTPSIGPVTGGTLVRIKGTRFSNNCVNCDPQVGGPDVLFGGTRATSVQFIDSTTIDVVTPPVLTSTMSVTVKNYDCSSPTTLQNAFTFQGDPNSAFDPVLFPLFNAPAQGAYGSEFHTTVRISNKGGSTLSVYGISFNGPLDDPPRGPFEPYNVASEESQPPLSSQTTGRVLYVAKGSGKSLAASIRVTDVTKQASSFGVGVPAARLDDFDTNLVFMGVPADSRFRCKLRLYSLRRGDVLVNVGMNGKLYQVYLKHFNDQDLFDPAYLEFNDFPALFELPSGQTTFRISVVSGSPIWGMVSVTNNETQQITTITPN